MTTPTIHRASFTRLIWALIVYLAAPATSLAASLEIAFVDDSGSAIEHVSFTLTSLDAPPSAVDPGPPQPVVINQVDLEFEPRVTVVQTSSEVIFPNQDQILHHVYSFSPTKQFELPLYKGVPANPVRFEQAGVVKLGCNIHDWMQAYVWVVDTPYFATSDQSGVAHLVDIPNGRYQLQIWHPDQRDIVDPEDLSLTEDVKLQRQLSIQTPFTPRRGGSGSSSY